MSTITVEFNCLVLYMQTDYGAFLITVNQKKKCYFFILWKYCTSSGSGLLTNVG